MITIGAASTAVAVSGASGHADAARQAVVPAAATGQLLSFMRAAHADGPGAGNGQGHGNGNGNGNGNGPRHVQSGGSQGQGSGDQGHGSGSQGPAGQSQGSQGQGSGDQGQGAQGQGQGSGAQGNGQGPTGDGRHRHRGHDHGNGNGRGNQAQGPTGDQGNSASGPQASPQGPTGDAGHPASIAPRGRHHDDRQHSPRHTGDNPQGSGQAPTPPPTPAPAPPPAPPVVVTPPPATPTPKPAHKSHPIHRHHVARVPRPVTHPAPSIRRGLAGSLAALEASAASRVSAGASAHGSSTGSSAAGTVTRPKPHSHHSGTGGGLTSSFFPTPITRLVKLVKFVPGAVWLALAVSVGLALLGMGAAVFFRRREVRQAGKMAEVETAALTDALTGVLNRRGFEQAVERELARSRRYGRPFVLAYADVRGLKGINDSEGHLAGDQLLKSVATVLGESARAHDVIGRLGGDEFALLLPEQSGQDVGTVIERICDHLQAAREELGFQSYWGLTVGAAAFPVDGESFDDLLAVADRRLYEKRGIELLAGAH